MISASCLEARVLALPSRVDNDLALVRRGQYFSTRWLLGIGDKDYRLSIDAGRVMSVEPPPLLMPSWVFAVRAPERAWRRFAEPVPPPGFHDVFAMLRPGTLRFEGDLSPLMANLLYVKSVLAHLRDES